MGNFRPIATKCWLAFLELHGWKFSKKVKGSHHKYIKQGSLRPIPVWSDKKEIPGLHISRSLKTMGIEKSVAYSWFDQNC